MSLADLDVGADGVGYLSLNRPEALNAIDIPTAQAIRDATADLAARDLRCLVLRGAGRAFVAGGDVKRFADDFARSADVIDALLDCLHPAILALQALDAPVVASVHGAVAGAGLSLMAGADLIIAAESTRFLMAYDRIGAAPDCGGTWFLPRRLGPSSAARLMLLGETWDAGQALAAGLVDRVVPDAGLAAATDDLALQLATRPTRALGAWKRLSTAAFATPLARHLEAERSAFRAATNTADFREGVTAFLARREPAFTGR
jgi:2-(1,2-epoxy-1,2-dihydrophenyl)acetyl-CoA isomerase